MEIGGMLGSGMTIIGTESEHYQLDGEKYGQGPVSEIAHSHA